MDFSDILEDSKRASSRAWLNAYDCNYRAALLPPFRSERNLYAISFARKIQEKLSLSPFSLKLSWSAKRRKSWGSTKGLSLAMLWGTVEKIYFHEYKSFSQDPDIGAFYCPSWQDSLRALVCHEISHTIVARKYRLGGHGAHFRSTYRALRNSYVKPFLGEYEIPSPSLDNPFLSILAESPSLSYTIGE